MFLPDVRSIVIANFAYTTVMALFMLFFAYRGNRRLTGLKWWTYGYLMMVLAFLVGGLGELIPPVVAASLPHVLVMAGFYFIKGGLAGFFDVRRRLALDAFFFIAGAVVLVALSGESFRIRYSAASLFYITAYVLTLVMVWRHPASGPVRIFFAAAALLLVARVLLNLLMTDGEASPDTGWIPAANSVLFFIVLMAVSFSLISVTVRRLLKDRDDLIEKEKRHSVTDELTGLMNRRGFRTVYAVEEKRSGRRKSHTSFAVADIDHFKDINDTYGHDCGDEVLRYIADVFRREFRGGDILVRWGGDEFLIVQPETDHDACSSSLERTRQAVARVPFRRDGQVFYVTMSFGCHTATAGDITFDEHLKRADDCMYTAKRGGGNRIVGGTV